MNLLTNSVSNLLENNFVIIEDTADCAGQLLLLGFIKKLIKSHGHVHLFCLDLITPSLIRSFGLVQGVTCHEMSAEDMCTGDLHYREDLLEFLKKRDAHQTNFAVVIDSLNLLALNNDLAMFSRMLQKIIIFSKSGSRNLQLLGLLHRDCHDDFTVESIKSLASCVMSLKSTKLNACEYVSSILHKSAGGKVTVETIYFTVSPDTLDVSDTKNDVQSSLPTPDGALKVHQLADKLTFSVSLKNEEKRSRAQLVLPYEKIVQMESNTSETGQIVYIPDEADDFDDEDPDDDLNI